jgi:hypothetical protein
VLEALPGLLGAGTAVEQLVVGAIGQIKVMQAQGRDPTPTEWAAINAQIAALESQLDVPEGEDPLDAGYAATHSIAPGAGYGLANQPTPAPVETPTPAPVETPTPAPVAAVQTEPADEQAAQVQLES